MPGRANFAQTMTAEEQNIMQQHILYWKGYMDKGTMLLFGPVLDPNGTFGVGVITAENEAEVDGLIQNDPASAINKYEYYPMMAMVPAK